MNVLQHAVNWKHARSSLFSAWPRSSNSFQSHNPKNAPTFTNYSKNTTERSINCTGSGYTELNVILTYSKTRPGENVGSSSLPGEEGRSISRTQLDSRRNCIGDTLLLPLVLLLGNLCFINIQQNTSIYTFAAGAFPIKRQIPTTYPLHHTLSIKCSGHL